MPLRGASIRTSPYSEEGVIDLGRVFGSKKGLDPTAEQDLAQIKAVASGYATGAYNDEQVEDFLQQNPAAESFLLPVVHQVKSRKEISSKYFAPQREENVITGGADDQMVRMQTVPGRADTKGAILEALSKGDTEFAKTLGFGSGAETPFAKIDPKDYTSESIKAFATTGDQSVLVPRGKQVDPSQAANNAFDQEAKLRGEFNNASGTYLQVRDAYGRIEQAALAPSAAGDLALLTGYMKLIDPSTGVKEGEFANASNAAGVPERVRNLYNRAMTGERLGDSTRKDFLSQAKGLYKKHQGSQKKNEARYKALAKRYNLDPEKVISNLDLDEAPQAPPAPTQKVIGGKTYVKENGKWYER